MSDRRHTPRPSLPEGYQYGDARPEPINPEGATFVHEGLTYTLGAPLAFRPDAFEVAFRDYQRAATAVQEKCALCGGSASWDMMLDQSRCSKCGACWISGTGVAGPRLSDEEFREKYLRPAVEHDPQGAADLIDRWRAPHENAAEQLKRQAADAGNRIQDLPDQPIELRCRECGQPPDIFHRRTRVETDADGRAHVVSGAIVYCPSAFHFDPPQRTGDETV